MRAEFVGNKQKSAEKQKKEQRRWLLALADFFDHRAAPDFKDRTACRSYLSSGKFEAVPFLPSCGRRCSRRQSAFISNGIVCPGAVVLIRLSGATVRADLSSPRLAKGEMEFAAGAHLAVDPEAPPIFSTNLEEIVRPSPTPP